MLREVRVSPDGRIAHLFEYAEEKVGDGKPWLEIVWPEHGVAVHRRSRDDVADWTVIYPEEL